MPAGKDSGIDEGSGVRRFVSSLAFRTKHALLTVAGQPNNNTITGVSIYQVLFIEIPTLAG